MTVFKEHYEITGKAALAAARAHAAGQQAARDAHWELINKHKADGYRPTNDGLVKTLLFAPDDGAKVPRNVPAGMRYVRKDVVEGKVRLEYAPSRNTKAGRELAKEFAGVARMASWRTFADAFGGFGGRSPLSIGSGSQTGCFICYPGAVHLSNPKERFFLTYPRELKDGWSPPPGIKLVRESDMLRAIEDHNVIAEKKRKAKK